MGFDREPEESFDYLNAVKNGSPAEIARQVERAQRIRKEKWDNLKAELQSRQEPERSKIQHVEKTPDIEQPTPKKQQEEDLELLQKPKRAEVSAWACNFSIFRHKGSFARRICKGTFHSSGKNLLCSLRSCGIFYPSPLTNTQCFADRCLGKKKKCCSLVDSVLSFCYLDLSAWWESAPVSLVRNIIL